MGTKRIGGMISEFTAVTPKPAKKGLLAVWSVAEENTLRLIDRKIPGSM